VHRGRVHWARALETPTFLPVQSPARTPIRSAGYWRGARMSACGARRAPVPPPPPFRGAVAPDRPFPSLLLALPLPKHPPRPLSPLHPFCLRPRRRRQPPPFLPPPRPPFLRGACDSHPPSCARSPRPEVPPPRARSPISTIMPPSHLAHCSATAVPSRVSFQATVGRRPRSACLTIPEDEEEGVVAEGCIGAGSIGLER
jgi:hypothetical protein